MIAYRPLLDLFPPTLLERLALKHQVDAKNQIRLPGSLVFTCILNGLLHHGDLTQRLLEEEYARQTGRTADHSAFGKRLAKIRSVYFADLHAHLCAQLRPQLPAREVSALRLRRVDATIVALSAKLLHWGLPSATRNAQVPRRQVKSVWELAQNGLPYLLRVCKDKSESSDCVALGDTLLSQTQPGDLWVFDKGCHDRKRLLLVHQAQAFFLTPHSQQALGQGRPVYEVAPADWPTSAPDKGEATFVVVRVEQGYFGNSHDAKRDKEAFGTMPVLLVQGLRFDQRTKTWKPLTLMTNLPLSADETQAGPYSFAELGAVYQQRWEIEVFFKFLKQHLGYSHLTSRNENGIQVMIYMSLIAALLLIWYKGRTGIDRGWRSVKFWFAENVRLWTQKALANALQLRSD